MSAIDSLLQRVQNFYDGLTDGTYLSEIINNYDVEICEMNSIDQLYDRGVNRVGVDIMDYMPYTPKTIEIKEIKGQPTNRVTLHDEGDFYRSFKVVTSSDKFEIVAEDWKTEHLVKKYGRQILGLTDENASELTQSYIYPDLLAKAWDVICN